MNKHLRTLVEFSRNLGVVKTEKDAANVKFTFLSRSPEASQISFSIAQLEAYAKQLGMTVENGDSYPGWSYAEVSPLRDTYAKVYRELFDKDVEITVIHAGLECAIIKEKVPDMDIISCGPVVRCLHSPDEYMDLASFERFFTIIKNFLKNN
jgi:dipeptidase D